MIIILNNNLKMHNFNLENIYTYTYEKGKTEFYMR